MSSDEETQKSEEQIEDFDPDRQGSSARAWLKRVETFAKENHLSEDQMYSFAQGKLTGVAKEWLPSSKVTGWQEFREAFAVAFPEGGADRAIVRKHRTMERRKRTANETVHDYIEAMLQLGKRFQLSEEQVVRYAVVGLGDPVLSKAIPNGVGLQQLLKAVKWQREVESLMQKYHASEVTTETFDKLAEEMESFVLEGGHFTDVIQGDGAVLKTIAAELNAVMRHNRSSLSCGLFDLGTSKTHQIVVNLKQDALIDTGKTALATHKGSLQSSLIALLTCDVIQKSSSSYLRPVHHNDLELLLDMSHLNTICCRESANFLLPQQLLPALSAFRYFTVLDFNGGHLQIPLEPGRSRSYFAFSTPYGPFEFQRAPKNFANTTIIFNKILIELARKLQPGDAVVLNDVLVVPGYDTADGLQKLSRVLTALGAFGLTADLRRSRFFERDIALFNWTVQHGKVIASGLPFEPAHPGQRLTLLVKLSDDATTCHTMLRKEDAGSQQTVGCFRRTGRHSKGDIVPDHTSHLVAHLEASIEHFRQFLLFATFGVVLDKGSFEADEVKRRLVKVQQFDFDVIIR